MYRHVVNKSSDIIYLNYLSILFSCQSSLCAWKKCIIKQLLPNILNNIFLNHAAQAELDKRRRKRHVFCIWDSKFIVFINWQVIRFIVAVWAIFLIPYICLKSHDMHNIFEMYNSVLALTTTLLLCLKTQTLSYSNRAAFIDNKLFLSQYWVLPEPYCVCIKGGSLSFDLL